MNLKNLFSKSKAPVEQSFSFRKISTGTVECVDKDTITYCAEEGNRYIDGQVQQGREIRNKSISFLGIVAAILVPLMGALVFQISREETGTMMFFLNLYSIMCFLIITYKLIRDIIYDRAFRMSGSTPAYILQEKVLKYMKDHALNPDDCYKYIVAIQLNIIGEKIEFNRIENTRLQESFKSCVKLMYFYVLSSIPLLLWYWILK